MSIPEMNSLSIIVIDDEPFIRGLLVKVLGSLGILNIIQAGNGREGLDAVAGAGTKIDLIICDLEMPEMDGFDFVANLRADENQDIATTPVLILTGHIDQENVEKAVNLGIHGYLKKPVQKEALEKRMVRALTAPPIDASRLKR